MSRRHIPARPRQRGVAMIFVLIMLAIVMVVVTVSARLALLSERSARNDRDRQIAFQAAEAALNDAELDIMDPDAGDRSCRFADSAATGIRAGEGCSNDAANSTRGVCGFDPVTEASGTPIYKSINWDDTSNARRYVNYGEYTSRATAFQVGSAGTPAVLPKYIIVQIPGGTSLLLGGQTQLAGVPTFKVYALGYGASRDTQVMLEGTFLKPVLSARCATGALS